MKNLELETFTVESALKLPQGKIREPQLQQICNLYSYENLEVALSILVGLNDLESIYSQADILERAYQYGWFKSPFEHNITDFERHILAKQTENNFVERLERDISKNLEENKIEEKIKEIIEKAYSINSLLKFNYYKKGYKLKGSLLDFEFSCPCHIKFSELTQELFEINTNKLTPIGRFKNYVEINILQSLYLDFSRNSCDSIKISSLKNIVEKLILLNLDPSINMYITYETKEEEVLVNVINLSLNFSYQKK